MTMQIPQFFINPLEAARQAEQVKLANYRNVLAEQTIGDEQQKRAGYEAAYKNWLTPQQTQQAGVIEPTSAIQQLYGGTAQPVPEPQESQSFLPQPYTPPEGSNYAYIQGANEANDVFQKQQQEYYTQNIAPLMTQFIKTGDNENFQKLMGQLVEATNPVAGIAKNFASMLKGSSVPTPGKVSRVPMTDELRQVLLPMAANPAIKAAIETLPVGELADVDMVGDNITNFTSPREYGRSQEELDLQRTALELRKKSTDLRAGELAQKYDPEVQGAIAESKEASKDIGKEVATARKNLPIVERKLARGGLFDRLEKLVDENPNAFGKIAKLKTGVAAFTDPAAFENALSDVKARRQLEIQVRNLLDDNLKKMFGPPFSDSDLKIMFQMTGSDLNSPAAIKESIAAARMSTQGELAGYKDMLNTIRRPTTIPRAVTPTPTTPDPRELKAAAISAKQGGKNRFSFNGIYYRIVAKDGTYTVLPEK